jgi:hypothetical protein
MRRRAVVTVLAILLLLILTAGTTLTLLAHHVPGFYSRNAIPAGHERHTLCREFLKHFSALGNALGDDQPTEIEFTDQQFNSYFQEQEPDGESSIRVVEIPDEIHDVRLAMEDDRIRLGFRFGHGWWSSVVTIDLRVWLVAGKPNVIALELCGFRAGALPLGTQVLLDYVTDAAHHLGIEVTWYRNQGHPVALLQLLANQSRPTFQIHRLEIRAGRLVVACSPTYHLDRAPPPSTTPVTR